MGNNEVWDTDGPRKERPYNPGVRAEHALRILDRVLYGSPYAGVRVTAIKLRIAGTASGESMAVLTGDAADGTPVVAFHVAVSADELFSGCLIRLENGTLKWRKDEYR